MFGLIGVDYGWGFDSLDSNSNNSEGHVAGQGHFQFTIGMNIGSL